MDNLMNVYLTRIVVTTALLLCSSLGSRFAYAEVDPHEIMTKNFYVTKVSSYQSAATMVLLNDRGERRVRKITTWSKLKPNGIDSKVLVRFQSPADVKGTGFLQIENHEADDDIWIYLPALKKTRRLVSNNKRDSFFGTDFAYGDVLTPDPGLYSHKLIRTENPDGIECFVIESAPISDKVRDNMGYSRKVSWIRKDNFLEHKIEYYDLSGRLLKTQLISESELVERAKNRWMSRQREMINNQSNHRTVFRLEEIKVGMALADAFFSDRSLGRE